MMTRTAPSPSFQLKGHKMLDRRASGFLAAAALGILALGAPGRSSAQEETAGAPVESPVAPVEVAPVPPAVAPADIAADALVEAAFSTGRETQPVDVSGFADFDASRMFFGHDAAFKAFLQENTQFLVGHINVYLSANITEDVRSLVEVRLLYLPNGASKFGGGALSYQSTAAQDSTDFQRTVRWGGIDVERAFLEWAPREWFSLRVGQWLTPYGIWNEDHGSPTFIPTQRPYLLSAELLPDSQTGFEAFGSYSFGALRAGYALTLSNGRGPASETIDFDRNKAVGARLWVESSAIGDLRLGLAGYRGRYTEKNKTLGIADDGTTITVADAIINQYDEQAVWVDLKWEWKDLTAIGEAGYAQRHYTDRGRPALELGGTTFAGTLVADDQRYGSYALVGYRTACFGIMPYLTAGTLRFGTDVPVKDVRYGAVGLNMRVDPRLVLKVQYIAARFTSKPMFGFGKDPISGVDTQVAWAF